MPSSPHSPPSSRHILAELTGCPAGVLDNPAALESFFRDCAERGGATVVSSGFHHFSPQGVSGVVIIAESHVTVHTWPEHGYAAVDVFTCGRPEIAEAVMELIVAGLSARNVQRTSFERGPDKRPARLPSPVHA